MQDDEKIATTLDPEFRIDECVVTNESMRAWHFASSRPFASIYAKTFISILTHTHCTKTHLPGLQSETPVQCAPTCRRGAAQTCAIGRRTRRRAARRPRRPGLTYVHSPQPKEIFDVRASCLFVDHKFVNELAEKMGRGRRKIWKDRRLICGRRATRYFSQIIKDIISRRLFCVCARIPARLPPPPSRGDGFAARVSAAAQCPSVRVAACESARRSACNRRRTRPTRGASTGC
jgi:hypothetical protein